MSNKKELGQYFTKNVDLQNNLVKLILNNPTNILEPSVGRGDLVAAINKIHPNISFDCFEIDNSIDFIIDKNMIVFTDFLNYNINKKYTTIIGNPPYVKTKHSNLFIDFISKCFNLLNDNGELIFIIPTDLFKLTSASKLLSIMYNEGAFTHIYHPNNERLFDNASIDVVIFRYCKNKSLQKNTLYNSELLYCTNSNGLITFNKNPTNTLLKFSDYFDIYVGLVSGKDDVFKHTPLGNISVIQDENTVNKFIYINTFPSTDKKIDKYLLEHKDKLLERKIRKFNDNNWFEWGAPRNIKIMQQFKDNDCIYIRNLTRNSIIAFKGKIGYFGGSLLMLKPKSNINLNSYITYLNSPEFRKNFTYSGRFKIGHKQISDSFVNL